MLAIVSDNWTTAVAATRPAPVYTPRVRGVFAASNCFR